MTAPGQDKSRFVVDAETALREERERIGLADGEQPAALCLSGGGIRSAAVCLGVLQALARARLLPEFHYLSTVSGGGYTGGWLTRLIADQNGRDGSCSEAEKAKGVAKAQAILSKQIAAEQPELDRLRRFTNFLAPNPGLASLDTWAGIVLWLRNTFINWALFVPVMVAIAAVPVMYCLFAYASAQQAGDPLWPSVGILFAVALGGLAVSVIATLWHLPSYQAPEKDRTVKQARRADAENAAAERAEKEAAERAATERAARASARGATRDAEADGAARGTGAGRTRPVEKRFGSGARLLRNVVVVPVLLWAFLLPLALAPVLQPPPVMPSISGTSGPGCPIASPAGCTAERPPASRLPLGWPEALTWQAPLGAWLAACAAYLLAGLVTRPRRKVLWANWLAWLGSSAVSALLLWGGIHLARGADAALVVLAAPLGIIVTEILRWSLYVAFRKDGFRSDLDREWLARLSANKLRVVLAFAVLGIVAVVVPSMIFARGATAGSLIATLSALATGPVAAVLGKSATTVFARTRQGAAKPMRLPVEWLLVGAAVLFGVAILAVLGQSVVAVGTLAMAEIREARPATEPVHAALLAVGGLILLMLGAVKLIGRGINLNRFSMHAVYRNRIVRAFMGSARRDHQPDRYTSFDPLDDLRVSDAFDRLGAGRRLFPVINVALNRTTGKDTARAARKAVSFTITPLRCGGASLIRKEQGKRWAGDGAYVRTSDYAGSEKEVGESDQSRGIRLGTAVTLSGAAVSPNMGYHSSPLIAFLMTLFNVRLGAWLPNPATVMNEQDALQSGPQDGVSTILSELVGVSSDESPFVYLSDGGHFDNLGLYEMLRRRCGRIVVVDAAQDEAYAYYDLGTVLQRARIDFGIEINFLQSITVGKALLPVHGAYASIAYPEVAARGQPAATGSIIYLKSWLPGDAPTPLRAFQALKANFPHDTTANQFFTETDFESYRALGDYLASQMLERTDKAAGGGQVASGLPGLERVFFGAERLHNASA
ncbi:patatin-like phospholipase family protein [uncultured Methylobacterium sp.]|uniref:patatin-like phospholipase family protein n=1 Tax=uncultured Methylobacterium sp. TaxID=157278 RepID=UPI0025860C96|nr:patatin-like phospholipase family protein [uncultured Methylobacterium sp.]